MVWMSLKYIPELNHLSTSFRLPYAVDSCCIPLPHTIETSIPDYLA